MESINVKKWQKNGMTRWYLTCDKGSALGYVQQTSSESGNSMYDNHRRCKGDTEVFNTSHTVNESVLKAIEYSYQRGVINIPMLNKHAGGSYIDPSKKGIQHRNATPILI